MEGSVMNLEAILAVRRFVPVCTECGAEAWAGTTFDVRCSRHPDARVVRYVPEASEFTQRDLRMLVHVLDISHAIQGSLDSTPEAVAHVEGLRDRIVRVLSERAGVTVDEGEGR